MKKIAVILLSWALVSFSASAQEPKAKSGTFVLTNIDIHPVTGPVINDGTLIIKDGKIAAINPDETEMEKAEVIDCTDLHVYPGMIDAGTGLGLKEIGSISLTQDRNEIGDFTPHMKALTAVNPNSVLIPVNRATGVTSVLTVPTGGTWPGVASLIHLHGYTPDQMHADFDAVVLNFPRTGKRGWWDRRDEDQVKKDDKKKLKRFAETWEKVEKYAAIDSAGQTEDLDYNPEMETLLRVYKGELSLLIQADREKEILSALRWIKTNNLKNVILSGVQEGWRVADSIATAGVPVIVGPVLSNPTRGYDRYDAPYSNAAKLSEAGVLLALKTEEVENVRNLPFHAGFAATYGLGKEEALKAVTINPARIFGIEDKVGSIEEGKTANLFITDGDPFETKTQVHHLFINGWKIPLQNRQSRLYDEFLERAPGN